MLCVTLPQCFPAWVTFQPCTRSCWHTLGPCWWRAVPSWAWRWGRAWGHWARWLRPCWPTSPWTGPCRPSGNPWQSRTSWDRQTDQSVPNRRQGYRRSCTFTKSSEYKKKHFSTLTAVIFPLSLFGTWVFHRVPKYPDIFNPCHYDAIHPDFFTPFRADIREIKRTSESSYWEDCQNPNFLLRNLGSLAGAP